MNKQECTSKIQRMRGIRETDEELANRIGISKPTLYARLKTDNWKKGEIELIKNFK